MFNKNSNWGISIRPLLMSGLKVFMQWLNKKNIDSRYQVCYSKAKGIELPPEWRQKREEVIERSSLFMTTSRAQYHNKEFGVFNGIAIYMTKCPWWFCFEQDHAHIEQGI